MSTVDLALLLLAVVTVLTFIAGLAGGRRIASRVFLFGLVVGCIQLAVIELVSSGATEWGVTR